WRQTIGAKTEMVKCKIKQPGSALRCGTGSQKLPHSIYKRGNPFTLRVGCAEKRTTILTVNHDTHSRSLPLTCISLVRKAAMNRCPKDRRRPELAGLLRNRSRIYQTKIFRSSLPLHLKRTWLEKTEPRCR